MTHHAAQPPTTGPRISVIIATFNAPPSLDQTLNSVLNQTYANRELIVIDGGSTDGSTVERLRSRDDRITYWTSQPDEGIFDAWNKGIGQATGDWYQFIGADEYLWSEDVLARMAPSLSEAEGTYRIVYGRGCRLDEQGRPLWTWGDPWPEIRETFRHRAHIIPHPSTFHHRDLFRQTGLFDTSFALSADYELLMRELKDHDALAVPEVMVTGVRNGGLSTQPRNRFHTIRQVRAVRRRYGVSNREPWAIVPYTRAWIRIMLQYCPGSALERIQRRRERGKTVETQVRSSSIA